MQQGPVGEVLEGLWRFEERHPEWSEEEGGEDGWEQIVAWWSLRCPEGLVLIDPLVSDWGALDRLVADAGGVAGIIRTVHWHERSIQAAAERYSAELWAMEHPEHARGHRVDHAVKDGDVPFLGVRVLALQRLDEIALWLADRRALLFAYAMLRRPDGSLRVCPDSWLMPEGGPQRLRVILRALCELPIRHVLVSHGPLVLGDGRAAMQAAAG